MTTEYKDGIPVLPGCLILICGIGRRQNGKCNIYQDLIKAVGHCPWCGTEASKTVALGFFDGSVPAGVKDLELINTSCCERSNGLYLRMRPSS